MAAISPVVLNGLQAVYGTADYTQFAITRQFQYDTVSLPTAGGAQQPINIFAVPQGGADPISGRIKTQEQTNLAKSGSLGQKFFALNAIRCAIRLPPKVRQASAIAGDANYIWAGLQGDTVPTGWPGGAMQALADFHTRGVLNFAVLAKNYLTIDQPALRLPLGAGINVQAWSHYAPGSDYPSSGQWVETNEDSNNVWVADPELLIEPDAQMTWTLSFPDSVTRGLPVLTNTVPIGEAISSRSTPTFDFLVVLDGYVFEPVQ